MSFVGPAELLLTNANFVTLDEKNPRAESVAVRDGRILAVGAAAEVERFRGSDTRVMDLGRKTVIPGIIDSHNHITAAGRIMKGIMLFDAKNMDDVRKLVAERIAQSQPGEWIIGGGWIESQFEEYRAPNRHDLDDISPDNPVCLNGLFACSACNTLALRKAGITRETKDPPRGGIERDATGEPTGVMRNFANSLIMAAVPQGEVTDVVGQMKDYALTALNEYLRWGITSVVDPGSSPLAMRAYQELYLEKKLPLRVNMMPTWWGIRPYEGDDLTAKVPTMGIRTGFGDEWLSIGALKMAIDGGLAGRTSWMHEPWIDGTHSTVPLRLDVAKLRDYFDEGQKAGWSMGIHCIGDRAQDVAVEAFAAAMDACPRDDVRHNIIHGYFPSERSLDLMQSHNIAVSVQPGFTWVEGDIYFDALPEKRLWDYKPLKTYLERGIHVAANSDMTSAHYNPFLGMAAAVTRRTSKGRVLGERERISVEQMLPMFTIEGAYLTFEEDKKGTLEAGKLADLAVLSDDITRVDPEKMRELHVEKTFIGGKLVYEAKS